MFVARQTMCPITPAILRVAQIIASPNPTTFLNSFQVDIRALIQ